MGEDFNKILFPKDKLGRVERRVASMLKFLELLFSDSDLSNPEVFVFGSGYFRS